MIINVRCPNLKCRKILKVLSTMRGDRVRCAYCKKVLKVPLAYEKTKAVTDSPIASPDDN